MYNHCEKPNAKLHLRTNRSRGVLASCIIGCQFVLRAAAVPRRLFAHHVWWWVTILACVVQPNVGIGQQTSRAQSSRRTDPPSPITDVTTSDAAPVDFRDSESVSTIKLSIDDSGILAPTPRTAPRYFQDPWIRSGGPQRIRRWAIPSTLANQYSGGWVGGSVPLLGEGRYQHEGTWGVDYDGLLRKPVWLHWTHRRRYQGGTDGYQTDGPRLLHPH